MAVEIPVVIDIEGAFQDAAKRVPQAMKTVERAIDERVLEVPVTINKKGDLKEVLDFVGKTTMGMDELKYAIKSAASELVRLKRKGASEEDVATYQKAILLLKSIRTEWQQNEKAAMKIGDAELRNLEIAQEYELAMRTRAQTIESLNGKIATMTTMLNNTNFLSEEFRDMARELGYMSRQLQEVQASAKIFGSLSGSVEQLNARVQLLNQQWNQMAASKKFTSDGKLTAEAQALLSKYRQVTSEMQKQGMSMSDIIKKEQERIQKHEKSRQQWQKENAILKTTVKSVDLLQAKVNILTSRLNKSVVGSTAFTKLNQELRTTQSQLDAVRRKISAVGDETIKIDRTFTNLLKKTAYLFGLHTLTRFIRNVREVTSEFELQRVALGGIIQDTDKANALFRQIKAAAIESPFQIKELVSYTKQLSAYRIETENLFDVTQRLADISAGLGVDMGRLILAYGQVRAASVLRGQELRQFTEAGIPLVEELAKKFTELNGSMVSTAEVFELISKRAVPFSMIEEIFNDMTDAGGIFYKMQEKQAETLLGQWNNLKDAVSIMYDEIGNTKGVHNAMERIINDLKVLMNNWRTVATILTTVGANFMVVKIASLFMPTLTFNSQLAEKATIALAKAEALEAANATKASVARKIAITSLKRYTDHMNKAAAATTLLGRNWQKFAASFLSGGWVGAAVSALAIFTGWLISARKEANRLKNEITEIETNGALSLNRSIANFRRLADAAVEAADGSDAQNKALAELQRTYGDIIPSQNLQIEKLRELKGDYDSLTEAIREKINMQLREQKINAATDFYSTKIQKRSKTAKNLLAQYGLDKEQINAVLEEVQNMVDDGTLTMEMDIITRARKVQDAIKRLTGLTVSFGSGFRDFEGNWHEQYEQGSQKTAKSISKLIDVYFDLNEQTDQIERDMKNSIGTMGIYAEAWDNLKKEIDDVTVSEETFGDKYTFAYKKEKIRKEVEVMSRAIEDAFKETGIDISDAFDPKGSINFDFLSKAAASTQRWGLKSFVDNVQKVYESIVPTNQMVGVVERKFQEIATTVGLSMDDVQGYLLRGEGDMREYAQEIATSLKEAQDRVLELQRRIEDYNKHPFIAKAVPQEEVDKANALVSFLEALTDWLGDFNKKTSTRDSYTQDPFINTMQERIKFMQDFKKGYDDLNKYMNKESARSQQAANMLTRGLALGMSADEQKRAAEELSAWYSTAIQDAFKQAQQYGAGTDLTAFLSRQITGSTNRDKALRDFQKLIQSLYDAQTDLDTSKLLKQIEESFQKMEDEMKRSDTVRDFYKNILDLTGDQELATSLSVSVYGGIGEDFRDRMQAQLTKALGTLDPSVVTDTLLAAFSKQDFGVILQNLDMFPEEWRKKLKEMAQENEKYNASVATDLVKSLQKAKTYSEKRVELAQQTARRMTEIDRLNVSDETKAGFRKQNAKKDAEEAAKLAYEAFKDTPMYVELFANLDTASTRMLENMRNTLMSLKSEWRNLDPTELKELQSRINEINKQLASKNPFAMLRESIKEYRELAKEQSREEADINAVSANRRLTAARQELDVRIRQYNSINAAAGEESEMTKNAAKRVKEQEKIVNEMEAEANAAQELANRFREVAQRIKDGAEQLQEWNGHISEALGGVSEIVETFTSADTADTFNLLSEGLTKTLGGVANIGMGMGEMLVNPIAGAAKIISGIGDFIGGVFGSANALKMNRINNEIEEQDDILHNLEKSYEALEKAIAGAFGSDYVYNYTEQLKTLEAEQAAYLKQAELEREKGKKADEAKIKEYEESAADTYSKIQDMQGQLAEHSAGTDVTSAARDFAKSWIDAYREFGSTTAAMKERFRDMVDNMIVESLAGKIIKDNLEQVYDMIDKYSAGGLDESEIADIAKLTDIVAQDINTTMTGLMQSLAAAGLNMRGTAGGFSGIAKDIAGASEQSINGLAAGINTQNYYMSYMPTISADVALIRAALVGEVPASAAPSTPGVESQFGDEIFRGQMNRLDVNIAEIRNMLSSVISLPNANTNTKVIATKI